MATILAVARKRPLVAIAIIFAVLLGALALANAVRGPKAFGRHDAVVECLAQVDNEHPELYPRAGDSYDSERWHDGDVKGWDITADEWSCTATDGYATVDYG